MVSLIEIKLALDGIQKESRDDCAEYIDEAIEKLKTAQEALNTISVRGRQRRHNGGYPVRSGWRPFPDRRR